MRMLARVQLLRKGTRPSARRLLLIVPSTLLLFAVLLRKLPLHPHDIISSPPFAQSVVQLERVSIPDIGSRNSVASLGKPSPSGHAEIDDLATKDNRAAGTNGNLQGLESQTTANEVTNAPKEVSSLKQAHGASSREVQVPNIAAKNEKDASSTGDIVVDNERKAASRGSYSVRGKVSQAVQEVLDRYSYPHEENPQTTSQFVIYRALGNDLPSRHGEGQTFNNTLIILESEPGHERLEKRWYVNRMTDEREEARVVELLIKHKQIFIIDSIDWNEYAKIDLGFDLFGRQDPLHGPKVMRTDSSRQSRMRGLLLHDKNLYIMHNNQARNGMIQAGFDSSAEFVLPWDGNCFLSKNAWQGIVDGIRDAGEVEEEGDSVSSKYFTVPMARLLDNERILKDEEFEPDAVEEPQIIFHKTAKERFNPKMRYGRRPKVELLWRLGVPGPWEEWNQADLPGEKTIELSGDVDEANTIASVGWVARLSSGMQALEEKGISTLRGHSRDEGIEILLASADHRITKAKLNCSEDTLMLYNEEALQKNRDLYRQGSNPSLNRVVGQLINLANREMENGKPYTVTDKTKMPPSGSKHDYMSLSPYYWPNPGTADGIPHILREGKRRPEAEMYGEGSSDYDRTRLANFQRNVTILALASFFTDNNQYQDRAAIYIRTWFLDEETRMNPHMKYSQMRFLTREAKGSGIEITDTMMIAMILDAVRIVRRKGGLSDSDMEGLRDWFTKYTDFLKTEANKEFHAINNQGTLYDVQMACAYTFLGDYEHVLRHTSFARSRIASQFDENGRLPEEEKRPPEARLHYMMYGYQAFILLATISEKVGIDMWHFRLSYMKEAFMKTGGKYLLPYYRENWSHAGAESQNMERMLYIFHSVKSKYRDLEVVPNDKLGEHVLPLTESVFDVTASFHTFAMIPQMWNLAIAE